MELPKKRSELLRLAVKDAKSVQRSKKHELDMSVVMYQSAYGKNSGCRVCMAGAVILRTLKVSQETTACNRYKHDPRLSMIDEMRMGLFDAHNTGVSQQVREARSVAERLVGFSFDSKLLRAPWSIYLKAASVLEAVGE